MTNYNAMKTIALHCKSASEIQSNALFMLKVISLVEHTYICRRSTDPSLIEIHQEMGELLDKQD